MYARRLALIAAIGIVILPSGPLGAQTAVAPTATSGKCPAGVAWSDAVLAQVLGVTQETVLRARETGGLTAAEICAMPAEARNQVLQKAETLSPGRQAEAARFRALQQASDNGSVRPDGLVSAFAERLARVRETPLRAGIDSTSWTSLGPTNIGGRLRTVLTHPSDPNLLLVGSASGGIWRSTDGGTTWAPVNDYLPNVSISSLVRDPGNAQRVYAGTGEGFFNVDAQRGFGVFVSNDGGSTWSQLGGTVPDTSDPPATQQSDFLWVNRVAVHPTNPDIVLVATRGYLCNWGGVYRTTNATSANPTWTKVYSRFAGDVRFDPNNGNNAVIGELAHCSFNGTTFVADGGNVAYSTDAGATFARVALDTIRKGRVELAWAKATPGLVVAVTEGNGGAGADGRFWVSTNGGQTWQLNSQPGHLAGQGWYSNALWIDPTNSTRVVVGGLDVYRGTGAANWWVGNTAVPWTRISQSTTAGSVHSDDHAIVPAGNYDGTANRVVYVGNDGGLYKSTDIAAHDGVNFTANWANLNNGLQVTQFYGGAGRSGYPAGVGTRIVGGTQDNGSLKSPSSGTVWTAYAGADGGYAAIDPVDPNFYYGELQNAAIHRATTGGNASPICTGILDGNPTYCTGGTGETNFIAPFILDPNNVNTLLVGGRKLWRSSNAKAGTPTWASIKDNETSALANYISAIAVAPGNANLVWVGYNHGEVYCTINGTAATPTWTKVTALTATRMVMRIVVDPADANRVFVTYGGFNTGNVKELTHATQVCNAAPGVADRHGNLPQAPVRSLVRNPANANWLYVGTEVGIFASTDGGATWSTGNEGPGSVAVAELFLLDNTTLVAATHGRGMFRSTLAAFPVVSPTRATDSTVTLSKLQGVVTGNGGSTAVNFEYGLTTAYGATVAAAQSPVAGTAAGAPVSANISGLTCGTTYHYRLTGVNNAGNNVSPDKSFYTWPCGVDLGWDVFWRKSDGTNAIWQYFGTGPLQIAAGFPPGVPTSWQAKAVGDVNGDGRPDVVWFDPAQGQPAIWLMGSTSTITSATFPVSVGAGSGWTLAGVADMNGDGRADLVWHNTVTGQALVWLMDTSGDIAGTWALGTAPTSYAVAGIGDFNGDGRADLMWFQASDGQVVVWLTAANGTYTPAFPASVGAGSWRPYRVADFDGDGKADVFWRNSVNGMTAAWYMNGGTIDDVDFFVSVPYTAWTLGSSRDFDRDGRDDLFWYVNASGDTTRWLMQGRHVAPISETGTPVGVNWQMVP